MTCRDHPNWTRAIVEYTDWMAAAMAPPPRLTANLKVGWQVDDPEAMNSPTTPQLNAMVMGAP